MSSQPSSSQLNESDPFAAPRHGASQQGQSPQPARANGQDTSHPLDWWLVRPPPDPHLGWRRVEGQEQQAAQASQPKIPKPMNTVAPWSNTMTISETLCFAALIHTRRFLGERMEVPDEYHENVILGHYRSIMDDGRTISERMTYENAKELLQKTYTQHPNLAFSYETRLARTGELVGESWVIRENVDSVKMWPPWRPGYPGYPGY